MSEATLKMTLILMYFIGVISMIVVIVLIRKKKKNKLEEELSRLETMKNLIIDSSILTEIQKVKSFLNNEKLELKYEKWVSRYKNVESECLPKLTDKLLDISSLIEDKEYKEAYFELAKAEIEIFYAKSDMMELLDEIREITLSEERNRSTITKLKALFREVVNKYTENSNDYKEISKSVDLQFENINKLFSAFEVVMENNNYEEVGKIVHALDDLIKNIKIVVDEAPTILLMGNVVIPKKIDDVEKYSSKMKKDGYNIEYMNLDYNIDEARKKLNDILDKLKVLNLEDSIFELKTMLDYFESLFFDFDKEKKAKKDYEEMLVSIADKLGRLSKIIKNIYSEVEEIKETYALSEDELKSLKLISDEISNEKISYKSVNDRTLSRITPYSRLSKDCEVINVKITNTEDKLETIIKSLGSLKEDEHRAREQLSEIRSLLRDSKYLIKCYKLPVIPKHYFIELDEAKEGIDLITKELEKKPITIADLNTRVDTGRDLVLKLYTLSKELSKTAKMAELAIVYGNRYRSSNKEIDAGLMKAEKEFDKGDYKKSLEISLNSLNSVEDGIMQKLLSAYQE